MKTFYTRFLLVFCVSLAFCGEDEKYSFIYGGFQRLNVGENWKFKISYETSFTIPEIGFIKYANKNIETIKFLGTEGEFWKFEATLTEMESDNYVNGIEIMDHYREALEGNSCYQFVKSSGFDDEVHHIKPVIEEDAYLQEAFEAAYMNIFSRNYRYPFGRNAVDVAEGDSWNTSNDSMRFYVNMGSPPSLLSSRSTSTLKRVKEKRGRKIATVERQDSTTSDLRFLVEFMGERRLLAGYATGTTDLIYKWDLDSGEMLKVHVVSNMTGNFEMDDKKFHMKIFARNIYKKVK